MSRWNQRREGGWMRYRVHTNERLLPVMAVVLVVALTISGCRNRGDQDAPSLLGKVNGPTRVVPPATGAAVSPSPNTTGSPSVSASTSTYPAANAWNYSVQSSQPAAPAATSRSVITPTTETSATAVPSVPAPPMVNPPASATAPTTSAPGSQPLAPQEVGGISPPRRMAYEAPTGSQGTGLVWRSPTSGVVPASATVTANPTFGSATSMTSDGLTPMRMVTPPAMTTATATRNVLPVVYYSASPATATAIPTTATESKPAGPIPTQPVSRQIVTTPSISKPSPQPPAMTPVAVEDASGWETGDESSATLGSAMTVLPGGAILPRPIDVTASR